MDLRCYQREAVFDVISSFENIARKILLVLPTGAGKSACASYIARQQDGYVWIIAHRQELLWQMSETLNRFDVPHGMVKAGQPFDARHRVQVASIQTLARRYDKLPAPQMMICDEAHTTLSPTYKKVIEYYPQARVLGVTATPCRLNGAGLGEIYEHMIVGPTNKWLTEHGFLSPAVYYAPPQVADTSRLPMQAGDFAKAETEAVMDKPVVTGDAVEHYKRICDGVPMLVFCTSVAHAKHVAEQYAEAGYRAASVDGAMNDEDRRDRIQGLGTGKWQIITSCDLIGEGLDVPVVGACQLLRPTASLRLHLQQIGRILRPAEGKSVSWVIDHVGNVRKHGFASTVHPWSLSGTVKPRKAKEASLRTCERCFLAHDPAPVCPLCGFIYPVKSKALHKTEIVDGQLVKIEETSEERKEALKDARSMQELIAFAKARGYSRPSYWAMKMYRGRNYLTGMPKL